MKKIIEIKSIERVDSTTVNALIVVDNIEETVKTTVAESMIDYVTIDRCDAFVYALLYFAISEGYDFKSDIPISEELYYNLQSHFLDALCDECMKMSRPRLDIPIINTYDKKSTIVATGISCGVDSLYTIATHSENVSESFRITHLAFFDVGSHGSNENKNARELSDGRYELCKEFAKEYGYTLFTVKSDINKIIERRIGYSHISNHTYMTAFCVLLLQSGIGRYYYSAGHPYQDFRCRKNKLTEEFDASFYDLLSSFVLSVNGIHFYSSGGSISRIQKTKHLCLYKPAYKYLNVCVNKIHNDGTCFKCIRTLLGIDAMGHLDDFASVFDVNLYKTHRTKYLQEMYIKGRWGGDLLLCEIIPFFSDELTVWFKIKAIVKYCLVKLRINR